MCFLLKNGDYNNDNNKLPYVVEVVRFYNAAAVENGIYYLLRNNQNKAGKK